MSDKPKPKEPGTQISGLFSIGFDDAEEGIPGVTQLLSPGAMKAKAEASEREVARLTAAKKAPMPTSLAPTVQKPVSKYGVTQTQNVPASERPKSSQKQEPVKTSSQIYNPPAQMKAPPPAPPAQQPPSPSQRSPLAHTESIVRPPRDANPVSAPVPPPAKSFPPNSHHASFGEPTPAPRSLSELTALIQKPIQVPAQAQAKAPAHQSDLSALIESGRQYKTPAAPAGPAQYNHPAVKPESKPAQKPAPGPSPETLREMGVQFELHFEVERGLFRYARMKGHSKEVFALWQQKFYFQMKLDLKALGLEAPFQEFEKNQDEFYADAFGLIEAKYVQVIRLEEMPTKLYVLLSDQSLKPWVNEVCNLLNGKKASGGSNGNPDNDAFVIELAS